MPVLATFFSVRRGRDAFFKFFMREVFPRQVRDQEAKFGIKFLGWYNVAYGWDFDNVMLYELPGLRDHRQAGGRRAHPGHRPPCRRMDVRAPPLHVPARAHGP